MKAIYETNGGAGEYSQYALNLYSGCTHACQYCYNKDKFTDPTRRIKKSSFKDIESDLSRWVGVREPVNLTYVGDAYDCSRPNDTTTRDVLRLFGKYDHPFQMLTKGGMLAIRDFDLYKPGDSFGVTLTFDNDVHSKQYEPGAALPGERVESLKAAHDRGIRTWVSCEPVIIPAQTLNLIEMTHEFVDLFWVGKLNHYPNIEKTIDWKAFRSDAENLFHRCGKESGVGYRLKRDLVDVTT